MKYRNPKKASDLFSFLELQKEMTSTIKGVNKLNSLIDWELFRKDLEKLLGYEKREVRKGGRPPFDPVLLLKVLVVRSFTV